MQLWNFLSLFFLSVLLPFATAGQHGRSARHSRHNADLMKRQSGDVQKRFEGTRWTYFAVGLGACGKINVASDFIVALNAPQFGEGYPGPNCFKSITMSYGGKTTKATITDKCPECPFGGLDLSFGLFSFFAAPAQGVIQGTWSFDDGSGGGTWNH